MTMKRKIILGVWLILVIVNMTLTILVYAR